MPPGESVIPVFHARLSPEGRPQVEHDGQMETFVAQRTERLNAIDAILRAACWAVADRHPTARIVYDRALESILPVFSTLPPDPAEAGLRKSYDLVAWRMTLELVPAANS